MAQADEMPKDESEREVGGSRLAVVTGASSGIGLELAKVFAKNGFDLIIAAEDEGIETAAADLRRESEVAVTAVRADLAKYDGVEKLVLAILDADRPLDVLAVNAGVGLSGEFIETDLRRELKMIQLNVMSAVHLTKRALALFLEQGHGKILFTSSIAATMPGPYYAVYAASKAFLQSFAEAIRYEVRDRGIGVTSLQPGPTETNFFERAEMMDTKVAQQKKDDPAVVAQQGFDALMRGEDHIVAGSFMNSVQALVAKFISETQAAALHASSVKPSSAKHS